MTPMHMSEAKHTSGPWELDTAGERFIGIHADTGKHVVFVTRKEWNGYEEKDGWKRDVYRDNPTADADARLIAAAPDLLTVAQDALVALEINLDMIFEAHCLLNEDLTPRRDTLEEGVRKEVEGLEAKIERTRAVIAKATGVL